ncbi:MAG: alpha/beta hydrolase [Pseudomonadota bacterium]
MGTLNLISGLKLLFLASLSLLLGGCVKATLAWADLSPKGAPATPTILDVPSNEDPKTWWEDKGKAFAREQLQAHVFGYLPDDAAITVLRHDVLDEAVFGGRGTLEEYVVRATATFNGEAVEARQFLINIVIPNQRVGPAPVILLENFSPRWVAIRHPKITRPSGTSDGMGGIGGGIAQFIFGRYVATPPTADILDRGYALAVMYPSEIVPDSARAGLTALNQLAVGHQDDATRWGAIAAWGWTFSRAIDVLDRDERVLRDGFITYGHSRYGKAALLAGAFDDRVAAVISHQSGTGGASLNRRKKGESIKEITDSYPHWFAPQYASYAGREGEMPIDQHYLLALLAPRPVLLGNARRDVWSDPNGALKAAIGADPVYKLYDPAAGLRQRRLKPFMPEASLSLWMRPGTHGVVKEDWPAFLDFLDAHFDER